MTLITFSISFNVPYMCILRGVATQLNLVQGDDVAVWMAKLCSIDLVNALADKYVEQYSIVT